MRRILQDVENGDIKQYESVTLEGVDNRVCVYHVKLMKEAGFVDAIIERSDTEYYYDAKILSVTCKGHDFLDANRNEENLTLGDNPV